MDALPFKLEDIKPKQKGRADFYSWGLYAWLKEYPNAFHIFMETEFDKDGNRTGNIYFHIGRQESNGDIMGAPLRGVCSTGKMPRVSWLSASRSTSKWKDVTSAFYETYMKIGVCAIHGDLIHKWVESDDGKTRTCQYCQKQETKQVKIVEVEEIKWV